MFLWQDEVGRSDRLNKKVMTKKSGRVRNEVKRWMSLSHVTCHAHVTSGDTFNIWHWQRVQNYSY